MLALEVQLIGHRQQLQRARVVRVQPVADAGDALARGELLCSRSSPRHVLVAVAVAHHGQTAIQQVHARFDVAAMIGAEAQHARRDRRAQRRARRRARCATRLVDGGIAP